MNIIILSLETRKLTDEAVSACNLIGINPQDLYEKYELEWLIKFSIRSFETFKETAENEEIAQMRFQHFEQRRRNKLKLVSDAINENLRNRAQSSNGAGMNLDIDKSMGFANKTQAGKAIFFNTRINRVSSVHNATRQKTMFSEGNNSRQMDYFDGMNSSAERMGNLNTERDQIKIQKLLKIKENIESLAKKEAMRYQSMMKKSEKREKLAKEYKKALIDEAKMRKVKYDSRRIQAKDLVQKSVTASEQKGVKIYSQYIKDIEKRLDEEKKKEKQMSFQEYENYKKRFEHSLQNSSFYNDKLRDKDNETLINLGQLDNRLNQGFDRSIMHRSEKAQRASYYTEKNRRIKDNQRLWKTQRKNFDEKFQRIKDQQKMLQKELDIKRKTILEKHAKEGELHKEAQQFIQEETQKKREWSNLKRTDQQENLSINNRKKELLKERLIEKHIVLKKQLEGYKQQQNLVLEHRKRQDKERRKLTEEIVETSHSAFRKRLMSQSLGPSQGLGGKDDDEKNRDINETK
ncbi:UNKNOWN [Stylonychia lemnae]|uniref:Uncharacterized protein n=1 Tax=Stylonychia lemnae TaxID=5949 RepID=A0A078AQC2_STYLE|nr:UNKNOWN [Stylonychia lemnae]|eukprot:CDW84610.1 UNKNOWN [Stylonychia lemnae]